LTLTEANQINVFKGFSDELIKQQSIIKKYLKQQTK